MAVVRASCPDCGDVEFGTSDIQVKISSPDGSGTYIFTCPSCERIVVKAAESRTVGLLMVYGIALAPGDLPLSKAGE